MARNYDESTFYPQPLLGLGGQRKPERTPFDAMEPKLADYAQDDSQPMSLGLGRQSEPMTTGTMQAQVGRPC